MQKKRFLTSVFLALLCVSGIHPAPTLASTAPDVVFSEIAWAGSSRSTADEWIELANMSDAPVSLSGWTLTGASPNPILFSDTDTIAPHSTFLIANYANTSSSSILETKPSLVTTSISIPNDKFTLTLTAPDRGVVDTAGSTGAPLAGISGGTGGATDGRYRSMERVKAFLDGTQKEAWASAQTRSGMKTDATDFGTPGDATNLFNTPITTPETTTEPTPVIESESTEELCTDIELESETSSTITETTNTTDSLTPNDSSNSPDVSSTNPEVSTSQNIPASQTLPPPEPGTVWISELFARPAAGDAEWVELENLGNTFINVDGWTLTDASGAVTILPNTTLAPGSFLVIENPKGKLNNDADTLILKTPDGTIMDSLVYGTSSSTTPGSLESLVRTNHETLVRSTVATRGTTNSVPEIPSAPEPSSDPAIEPSPTEQNVPTNPNAPSEESSPSSMNPSPTQTLSLRLSELYPNTGGEDAEAEFVELENTGDKDVSLVGWKLIDAGNGRYTFGAEATVPAHGFLSVITSNSSLSLNNSGDTVMLQTPDGIILDTISYGQAKAHLTYARVDELWFWTSTPTPSQSNVVSGNSDPIPTVPSGTTTNPSNTSGSSSTIGTNTTSLLSIAEAQNANDGARVTVRGIVTATPNTFNSQTMYIQDESGGIQIFKSDCIFPELNIGQWVKITGTISHINGEPRIKVSNKTTIETGTTGESIAPTDDTEAIGSLVTIAGMVTKRSGTKLTMNVEGETWNVDLPKGSSLNYQNGTMVRVNGILALAKNGPVLKTRTADDLTVTETPVAIGTTMGSSPDSTIALALIVFASVVAAGFLARHLWRNRSRFYVQSVPLVTRAENIS